MDLGGSTMIEMSTHGCEGPLWGWAKTNRLPPNDPAFASLSVLDHGLDVAAVFKALVRGPFRSALRHVLKDHDESVIEALASLVALHDLGKLSWCFQGRRNGPNPLARPFEPFKHHVDEACALLLHRDKLPGWRAALAPVVDIDDADGCALLRAVFSHHGKPRNGTGLNDLRDLPARFSPLDGRDPLELARQLVAALPSSSTVPHLDRPGLHWLMGITNLADWLGSSTTWFPLRPARRPGFDREAAAATALGATGLDREMVETSASDDEILARILALYTEGKAEKLRPVQERAARAIMRHPPAPGDVLALEDETGGGKTLTAYLVHALLARRGLVAGITFCLPTRASAKAIHDGAARVYVHHYPPILALPGYDEALLSPLAADAAQDDRLPWAQRSRHRFLVSPVAVGTIDQILLGALTVPYAHLRACALARNLLVVDEVHSSDLYMCEILAQAVASHRRQGGITLLMSATLGSELRARLLETTGVRRASPRERYSVTQPVIVKSTNQAPFPVLWLGTDKPVDLGDPDPPQKQVMIEPSPDWPLASVDRVAKRAVAAARHGARVLVIRNTVALARATMLAVRDLAPELLLRLGEHPVCHHARYAAADRLSLDEALRAALHPDHRTGKGMIAVTTQTAEQSLDIDADLLITDLVPVDVLLQRIGRLHRNRLLAATARPSGFREPRCIVLAPETVIELVRMADPNRSRPNNWGTDRAYADVLALARTRELIGDGAVWSIPKVNRDLVEAISTDESLDGLIRRLGPAASDARRHKRAKAYIDRELAGRGLYGFDDDLALNQLPEKFDSRSDGGAMTRLGASDIRLELDRPFTSPFGNAVAAVTVPGHLALTLELRADRKAGWSRADADTTLILPEDHGARFIYDPLGLSLFSEARP